jgi:hypothetical protein
MGNLIRDFSGPLTLSDTTEIHTPPRSTSHGRQFTDASAFEKSVEDLMPMPAKRPISGRLISDSESMSGKLPMLFAWCLLSIC